MNKLSDLELEKRIAEIEGVDVVIDDGGGWWTYIKSPGSAVKVLIAPYHPLTDKAMLLGLIFKHRVSIVMNGNGDNHAFFIDKDIDIYQPDVDKFPRAILEAIVEANNG